MIFQFNNKLSFNKINLIKTLKGMEVHFKKEEKSFME